MVFVLFCFVFCHLTNTETFLREPGVLIATLPHLINQNLFVCAQKTTHYGKYALGGHNICVYSVKSNVLFKAWCVIFITSKC